MSRERLEILISGGGTTMQEIVREPPREYGVPVVSGNVSLYNAYKNHSIKPTPILVMIGTKSL